MTQSQYTDKDAARFWSKVDRTGDSRGCWLWTGAKIRSGYGSFRIGGRQGKSHSAHRLAYMLTHGPIAGGLWVLHRCDTPACCNPDHLWLGTHDENMADMRAKGRSLTGDRNPSRTHPESNKLVRDPAKKAAGERHPQAKLTVDQVREIRRLHAAKTLKRRELAALFGVSMGTIDSVVQRLHWKEVA